MEHYGHWLGGVVAGDLGGTTSYSETVGVGVSRTIPVSAQLLAYSQLLAVAIAIPGALLGAQFRGRAPDLAMRGFSLVGLAVPLFITGILLAQVFGVGDIDIFGWSFGIKLLPSGRYVPVGDGVLPHLRSMALPSITLALGTAATYLVLLRSELLQQLAQDHVLLARSKGMPPAQILRRHALRPAAPSVVAAIAAQSGLVLGNVVIVERIFLLPGFGDYVIVAIGRRDEPAVVGALFVAAVILAVVNLVADAVLLVVDPRLDI
jgi:peptide/nickel transport system permease protein